MRKMRPRPQMALSDVDPTEISRPSSGETHSVGDSTIETSSIVGTGNYFSQPNAYQYGRRPPPAKTFVNTHATARGIAPPKKPYPSTYDAPWSPLRRRSSMPPDNRPQYQHPSSWPRGHPISPHHQYKVAPQQNQQIRPKPHARTPSTLSESSFTSDSSYTTSSASLSPVLRPTQMNQTGVQPGGDIRRSQSLGYFNQPPGPPVQSNVHPTHSHSAHQRRPSSGVTALANQDVNWNVNENGVGVGYTKPNERGLNVRWPDQNTQGDGGVSRVSRSNTVKGPDR